MSHNDVLYELLSKCMFAGATHTTTDDKTTHTWHWDHEPPITFTDPIVSYVKHDELGKEVWSDPTPINRRHSSYVQKTVDVEGRVVERFEPLMLPSGELDINYWGDITDSPNDDTPRVNDV